MAATPETETNAMPTEGLYRALFPAEFELRDTDAEGDVVAPVMVGHFARFNEWTEIDSIFEGRFMERIAPGAFAKTFRENRQEMRVLFQHGRDPQVGSKVLGPIDDLREDDEGAWYEVPLLDTSYVRDLLPGLKANLYGSSFRFQVMREEINNKAKPSGHNEAGLPERTIKEVKLSEFGPVTFPAYAGATAGVRSLTDEFMVGRLVDEPGRLREIAQYVSPDEGAAPEPSGATTPPTSVSASEPSGATTQEREVIVIRTSEEEKEMGEDTEERVRWTIEERQHRIEEIGLRQREIDREFAGDSLDAEHQKEWDALVVERAWQEQAIADQKARDRYIAGQVERGSVEDEREEERPVRYEEPVRGGRNGGRDRTVWDSRKVGIPSDLHDTAGYRRMNDPERITTAMRHGAREIVDRASFPHPAASRETVQEHVDKLLLGPDAASGQLARRIIATGSDTYKRAFGKTWAGDGLTADEQRALSETTTKGGFAVPFELDPTIIPTSNGSVNPLRQISRVESITTNEWRGVTSAGVSAAYAAEAAEATDADPTLAQPAIIPERATVFIPFSVEIGQDWGGLQTEMARMVQDAKDDLEATKFTTGVGHGSSEPEGFLVGATAVKTSAAATTFAVGDLYNLEVELPPRFRPRASIVGNRAQYQRTRQFDTTGGASLWIRLGDGLANSRTGALGEALLGYPTYENSAMVTTIASGNSILTIGDFSYYLIVDRVGMNAEVIPHLFGTTSNYPTGQRGLYFFWRNSAEVLSWNAFRTIRVV